MEQQLWTLYERHFGESPTAIVPLRPHASNRRIFRVSAGSRTAIGVVNPDALENRAFIGFTSHFRSYFLPVPEIYVVDGDGTGYLEEDLGDTTLYDALSRTWSEADPFPSSIERLYRRALEILPRFQIEAEKSFDYGFCHQDPAYDRHSMLADLRYFRDSFLRRVDVPFDEDLLSDDFDRLVEFLSQAEDRYFIYRDFQSRNIMVQGEDLSFIDYQGGRRGALQYDVVSLVYQARAGIPSVARTRLIDGYVEAAARYVALDRERFLAYLPGFVVIRLLQTLGTYGKVGLGGNNPAFVRIIPFTLRSLHEQLSDGMPVRCPEIGRVVEVLANRFVEGEQLAGRHG